MLAGNLTHQELSIRSGVPFRLPADAAEDKGGPRMGEDVHEEQSEPGEPHEPQVAFGQVAPSPRKGTRRGRGRIPPGGLRGNEDRDSVVVYDERPSSRRPPVERRV